MRIALPMLLLTLAGCGAGDQTQGDPVTCRLHSGRGLDETCRLVWQDRERFTLHHPDGGFRRLAHRAGAITAQDGAERVAVEVTGDGLQVSVGGDRYAIPLQALEPRE